MIITLASPPAKEPISTAEARQHCVIPHEYDDAYLDALITSARMIAENTTWRALITQTWDYYLDGFPLEIRLPKAPLQSVTSITYVDPDGQTQTLSTDVYTVDSNSEPGRIYPAYNQQWPTVRAQPKAVKVTYKAGYGDTGKTVPAPIRQAMLLLISHYYENREPVVIGTITAELPRGVNALLGHYRMLTL